MKKEENEDILMLNPLYLFSQEVKNKSIKKQSIQNAFTIALAMTSNEIVNELLPFFTKIMIEQNNQIRIVSLQAIVKIFVLAQNQQQKCVFLQWVVDILCVFQQQQIRKQAYNLLRQVLKGLSKQTIKRILSQAIKQLIENTQKNIRDVTLELIYFYYQNQDLLSKQDQQQLFQLLSKYKSSTEDKIILANGLSKIIQLIPAIQSIKIIKLLNQLLELNQPKIKAKLVQAVFRLREKTTENQALPLLEKLIVSEDSCVKCELIFNIERVTALFKAQNIQGLIQIFKNFINQSHDVKNAILKVLQNSPVDQTCMQQLKKPLNSMELKNSLIQSLCRINDVETLKKITASSDNDFKAKIYPKLPSLSEFHVQVVESLLQQKNFRSKLTIIQNVQKRVDQGENGQVLLQVLMKYLGDKTATVRMGICRLVSKIVVKSKKMSAEFQKKLLQSSHKQNWFQRQAAFLLIKEILIESQSEQIRNVMRQMMDRSQQQKVPNILVIVKQIKSHLQQIQ